jgi:hypothetical protein
LDVEALNKQLAKLPLRRHAPASPPAQAPATPRVRVLAADARRARLLQELVRLAHWTVTPREVTRTGALKSMKWRVRYRRLVYWLRRPALAAIVWLVGSPAWRNVTG